MSGCTYWSLSNFLPNKGTVLALESGILVGAIAGGVNHGTKSLSISVFVKNYITSALLGGVMSIPRAWYMFENPHDLQLTTLAAKVDELKQFDPLSPLITSFAFRMEELTHKIVLKTLEGLAGDIVVATTCLGIDRMGSNYAATFVAMATGFATQDPLIRIGMGMAASLGIHLGKRMGSLSANLLNLKKETPIKLGHLVSSVASTVLTVGGAATLLGASNNTLFVSSIAALIVR